MEWNTSQWALLSRCVVATEAKYVTTYQCIKVQQHIPFPWSPCLSPRTTLDVATSHVSQHVAPLCSIARVTLRRAVAGHSAVNQCCTSTPHSRSMANTVRQQPAGLRGPRSP